jgi:hypothetical protein
MHDPLVVAFDIRRPWPKRSSSGRKSSKKRWRIGWRAFWTVAGREWYWPSLVTIWHREPKGHDSGEVCRHYVRWQDENGEWHSKVVRRWRWHVHHWKIQIRPLQTLRRFIFERCEECGYRFPYGYAPISHQWDSPKRRFWAKDRGTYHFQCSSLDQYRRLYSHVEELVRYLMLEVEVYSHEDEITILDRLTGVHCPLEFHLSYRLQKIMGYERDDDYNLVKRDVADEQG